LDLTNRNAQYFYLARRVPIESGALYNLPNEQQQLRAVRALEAQQVPVVLASGSPMLMDGGPPSYRTYVVYRYLIWRYVPVVVNDLIFLVRPNRLDRVVAHFGREAHPGDPVAVLDRVFAQPNLQGLPASWGASWSTLVSLVAPVKRLDAYGAPSPVDADLVTPNRFRAAGSAPALSWSLAMSPIKGKDAGLLTFSFGCLAGDGHTELEVSWETPEGSGANAVRFGAASRVAVPLDASPRWLLARSITALRITVQQPDRCSEFSVEDAVLWQRRVVTATDPR
jgi:hypothetical protein